MIDGFSVSLPNSSENKRCGECGKTYVLSSFLRVNSPLFPSGTVEICNNCFQRKIDKILKGYTEKSGLSAEDASRNYFMEIGDFLCQNCNIIFIPEKWIEFNQNNQWNITNSFVLYNKIYCNKQYGDNVNWGVINREYRALERKGLLSDTIEPIAKARLKELKRKWGDEFSEKDLHYLEDLADGILKTQNVNGKLTNDQMIKLCKISLTLDQKIRDGEDIDKTLKSYDTLYKITNFTPKNAKNSEDFESIGELYAYAEKKGWVNPYFTDAKKDIVDETIANLQQFTQRLYLNEGSIGDEITERAKALKEVKDVNNIYIDNEDINLDEYNNEVVEELKKIEEFKEDVAHE
jgi:hypothetical protein